MNAKIGLEDVRLYGPHGYYDEENVMGNEFSIDVEVESNIGGAATNDDLGGTVNYSTIYYLLQAEMKKPTKLLEALAYRMANRIKNQFDSVTHVRLRLRKLNPPLGGKVGAAVVEVELSGGPVGFGGANPAASPFGSKSVFDDDDDPYGNGVSDLHNGPEPSQSAFIDEPGAALFDYSGGGSSAGFDDDNDDFDFEDDEDFDLPDIDLEIPEDEDDMEDIDDADIGLDFDDDEEGFDFDDDDFDFSDDDFDFDDDDDFN